MPATLAVQHTPSHCWVSRDSPHPSSQAPGSQAARLKFPSRQAQTQWAEAGDIPPGSDGHQHTASTAAIAAGRRARSTMVSACARGRSTRARTGFNSLRAFFPYAWVVKLVYTHGSEPCAEKAWRFESSPSQIPFPFLLAAFAMQSKVCASAAASCRLRLTRAAQPVRVCETASLDEGHFKFGYRGFELLCGAHTPMCLPGSTRLAHTHLASCPA